MLCHENFHLQSSLLMLLILSPATALAQPDSPGPLAFPAAEAHQGVAVDERYVYAVGTTTIGKYDKFTGEKAAEWKSGDDVPLIHLDSGVIVDGKLYCAHSNYPNLPMTSSVEIWDADTLEHIDSHSFGISPGSCTWVDRHAGSWWIMFAHYSKSGGYPHKGNEWTQLVQYNDDWLPVQGWLFPPEVIARFGRYSSSGGSWGPDGLLYLTGHDRAELYAMQLPKSGSVLKLVKIVPFPNRGQGIAFDRSRPGILYGIDRDSHTVVAKRVVETLH